VKAKAPDAAFARSKKDATSRYRGVYRESTRRNDRWTASIEPKGKKLILGRYVIERDAALAYDRAALHYFGTSAPLNFPHMRSKLKPADAETLAFESRRRFKAKTYSRFRGVTHNGYSWQASITTNGRSIYLGSFAIEQDAAEAYDRAALRFHRKKARLNFDPETGEELCGRIPRRGRP
jgi:AP2-like factor (ANT lineage)